MNHVTKIPSGKPPLVEAKPQPDADRASILERINARYENSLRYLGR